jgi:thioredoxin-related protein
MYAMLLILSVAVIVLAVGEAVIIIGGRVLFQQIRGASMAADASLRPSRDYRASLRSAQVDVRVDGRPGRTLLGNMLPKSRVLLFLRKKGCAGCARVEGELAVEPDLREMMRRAGVSMFLAVAVDEPQEITCSVPFDGVVRLSGDMLGKDLGVNRVPAIAVLNEHLDLLALGAVSGAEEVASVLTALAGAQPMGEVRRQ